MPHDPEYPELEVDEWERLAGTVLRDLNSQSLLDEDPGDAHRGGEWCLEAKTAAARWPKSATLHRLAGTGEPVYPIPDPGPGLASAPDAATWWLEVTASNGAALLGQFVYWGALPNVGLNPCGYAGFRLRLLRWGADLSQANAAAGKLVDGITEEFPPRLVAAVYHRGDCAYDPRRRNPPGKPWGLVGLAFDPGAVTGPERVYLPHLYRPAEAPRRSGPEQLSESGDGTDGDQEQWAP